MFLSRNKKNNVYPCKPQFYYIKVGFKGVKLYRHVFVMYASRPIKRTVANIKDSDHMPLNVASNLGLHCNDC